MHFGEEKIVGLWMSAPAAAAAEKRGTEIQRHNGRRSLRGSCDLALLVGGVISRGSDASRDGSRRPADPHLSLGRESKGGVVVNLLGVTHDDVKKVALIGRI